MSAYNVQINNVAVVTSCHTIFSFIFRMWSYKLWRQLFSGLFMCCSQYTRL